jgi:hypothetical protein
MDGRWGAGMSDQDGASEVAKEIGGPLGPIIGLFLRFLPEGPLQTLLYVVVGLTVAVWPFVNKYYLGVLAQGAKPESLERQDFDKLRASLEGGNLAARLYAKWLTGSSGFSAMRHGGPDAVSARLWFENASAAVDRARLRPLPVPRLNLSHSDDFSHLGHFRLCRPGRGALALQPELSGWGRVLVVVEVGFQGFAFWRAK